MRDGVKLATDIYIPPGPGKFPVLVSRSPYGKGGERRNAEFFARNGYVFVAQDVRGRGGSEGRLYPLRDEGRDGYDTIQWAAAQPWSNGKVGTLGASYLGMDQYGAAILKPPALAAMYVAVAGFSYFKDAAYRGGVRSASWPIWLLFSASTSPKAESDPELKRRLTALVKSPDEWLAQTPKEREKVFDGFPDQLAVYRDFYQHQSLDDYWNQQGFNPGAYLEQMKDVPIMMVGGWYDSFTDSMLEGFVRLVRVHRSEKRIQVGPWPHPYGKPFCGQATFGPQAELDERNLQLEWFDHWLKGAPWRTPVEPVRYFRMGGAGASVKDAAHISPGGEWRTSKTWPPSGTAKHTLYLSAERALDREQKAAAKPITYTFDPQHPNPTLGGRQGPTCIVNQSVERADLISFIGAPLSKAVDATGPVLVRLSISSDRASTDFTARLVDVYPDGYAMNLAEGQIRVQPLRPGNVEEVTLNLGSTSNLFEKGHRIRLDISSSSFPRLEPNPGTGEAGMWMKRLPATNSIHTGAGFGANLELTVLPD
jgi:putative CocE/NonD family hydrolase